METADLPGIEARMLRWTAAIAVLGLVALAAAERFSVALAFAVGVAFGALNFHWLWQTGQALMAAQTAKVPRTTVVMLILRYPLSFAALVGLYYIRWLSPLPVIAGLLIPSAGMLVEAILLARADLRRTPAA
jgi:hypothetical protein